MKLIADSTCDLSQEIIERYKIAIVPLTATIDGHSYRDGIDIQPNQFYAMIEGLAKPAQTAAPSPDAFFKHYAQAFAQGEREILVITMSSGTSACYQSAMIAAQLFKEHYPDSDVKLHVVDSVSMSHGSGWLLMKSAMLYQQGMSFEDIVTFNEHFKWHVKHLLSVDDLNHLIRSGRLSNASALVGKLLRIKPIMSMKHRKGAIVARVRGRKGVLKHYLEALDKRMDELLTNFIIIGYTSDRAYAENLKKLIEDSAQYDVDIYIMQMGVAVGVHVGLGGLALYFVEGHAMRDGLIGSELEKFKATRQKLVQRLSDIKDDLIS